MQTGRVRIVDLHAINAEVVLFRDRVFSVDKRQRDKWTTILLPSGQHRQLLESRRPIDNLPDGRSRSICRSEFEQVQSNRTMLPQLCELRRQKRLSNVHHLAHKRFRLWPKREIDPALRSKKVGHDGITTALHPREQQSRSTLADHASMDLGQLEVWVNLGFNGDDF